MEIIEPIGADRKMVTPPLYEMRDLKQYPVTPEEAYLPTPQEHKPLNGYEYDDESGLFYKEVTVGIGDDKYWKISDSADETGCVTYSSYYNNLISECIEQFKKLHKKQYSEYVNKRGQDKNN